MPVVAQVAALAIASTAPKNIAASNFDSAHMWKSPAFHQALLKCVNGSLRIAHLSSFSFRLPGCDPSQESHSVLSGLGKACVIAAVAFLLWGVKILAV